jgi:hypothetical protein
MPQKKNLTYSRPSVRTINVSLQHSQCMNGSSAEGVDPAWGNEGANTACGEGGAPTFPGECGSGSGPSGNCLAGGTTGQCVSGGGNKIATDNYFGTNYCATGDVPATYAVNSACFSGIGAT